MKKKFLKFRISINFFSDSKKESPDVTNSATGTASQTPFNPIICGRISKEARIQTKVLLKDTSADVFPSESAVNSEDVNTL